MKIPDRFFTLFVGVCEATVLVIFSAATLHAQDTSPATTTSSPATATSASQKSDTEWDGVTVELQSVTRGEGDVTIKFKYTNGGSTAAELYHSNYGHANIASLVYYIDPKNKKKYTVIKDAEQKPLASLMETIKIEPGSSKSGWCKLPAPPADVTSVTVVLPGAAPFEKVRILMP